MDLALALGFNSVAALEQGMSVTELNDWYAYRNEKLLPDRRFEYYFAQLTFQVANLGRLWGGPEYALQDFLLGKKPPPPADTSETGAAAIGAIAGGVKVIKLGQRRKRG